MLASRIGGNRLLVVSAVVTIVTGGGLYAIPRAAAPPPQHGSARYTLVPLSGDMLPPAEPGKTCVPFLAPLVAHPRWQVQIARAHSGCLGEWLIGSFSVTSDGKVVWSQPGLPDRELALSPAQLATVRGLDRLDCVRTERVGYGEEFFRVGIGGGQWARGGAYVSRSSALGEVLAKLLDDLVAEYRTKRLAAFAPITADLQLGKYRLALRGTHVTVRHGKRVLVDKDVDDAQVVDLLDAMIGNPDKPYERDEYTAVGTFSASGIAVPLAVVRVDMNGPTELLARALDEAVYYHDER